MVHDGLLEDRHPEHFDVLRSLGLQPVQNLIKSFLHVVFALHAIHLLHTHKSMEKTGVGQCDLQYISWLIVTIGSIMIMIAR